MADIELSLQRREQLFDTFDPSPFHAKALDRNAAAYLRDAAGEIVNLHRLAVVISGPPELESAMADMTSAIHSHFAQAHRQAQRRHRRRRRVGRVAIFAGVSVLVLALFLRSAIAAIGGAAADILAEGLLILAWIALWRPIETIGFDSWESRSERRVLAALATVPVSFRSDAPPP